MSDWIYVILNLCDKDFLRGYILLRTWISASDRSEFKS